MKSSGPRESDSTHGSARRSVSPKRATAILGIAGMCGTDACTIAAILPDSAPPPNSAPPAGRMLAGVKWGYQADSLRPAGSQLGSPGRDRCTAERGWVVFGCGDRNGIGDSWASPGSRCLPRSEPRGHAAHGWFNLMFCNVHPNWSEHATVARRLTSSLQDRRYVMSWNCGGRGRVQDESV